MEQSELLRYVTKALEQLGLRYFITGSVATIFFGEPRFTNDIDIVVDLPAGCIVDFCKAFPAGDFYVSEEAVRRAVSRKGQFNVIHPASGLKVDIMVPVEDAFNRSRFARTQRIRPAADYDAVISGEKIDPVYIDEWSARLGLSGIWAKVQASAGWRLRP